MAPKANEQDYEPEWLTGGLAFVEQDIVAQLIDERQWRHAFGIAFNAESEPQGRSFPYAAFKQIRPTDEPAFGVEEIYYSMYMLALGIQLAGPNLTPESFEAGMFSYRRRVRAAWPLAVRAGRLHPDRRLPRDLVGPEPHLGAEQQAGRMGPDRRRRPRAPPPTSPRGRAPFFEEG